MRTVGSAVEESRCREQALATGTDCVCEKAITGATVDVVMHDLYVLDEVFASGANVPPVLAVEFSGVDVCAHLSAAAIIDDGDWTTTRQDISF